MKYLAATLEEENLPPRLTAAARAAGARAGGGADAVFDGSSLFEGLGGKECAPTTGRWRLVRWQL